MGKKKTCLQDGCLQVHDRDVPQEAERRDALPAEDQVLALQAADKGPPCPQVNPSRQGQEAGIQEQTGLRDTVSRCAVVDARGQLPRDALTANPSPLVPSKNRSQRGTSNPLPRSAWAVDSRVCAC